MATTRLTAEYRKVSEIFKDPIFDGLKLDEKGSLRTDTRETVSLKQLKAVLLSKDMKVYEEYKKKFLDDKVLRFLDGEDIDGDRVCYQSFMRSGNTFLRKYLELILGVPTGSEMPA